MKLPKDNNWTQTNEGDIFGTLNETQNVTFDKNGVAKLSKKPFSLYTSNDDANLAYVLDISYFNSAYIALTSDELFSFDINNGTVSQLASTPTTSLASDAQVWNSKYFVTVANNLSSWNGSSWSNSIESLNSGVPHPMAVFDSRTTYKLAIGNGSSVMVSDGAGATGTALVLPSQFQVTTLKYRNGYLFVGTKNTAGGEARVFIWDGETANANAEIPTGSSWVFSMTEYANTVAFITEKGQLLLAAGNAAQQLAALPVYYDPDAIWQGSTGLSLNGKVMHEGMKTVGDTIYMNIDGDLASGFLPQMKSGLWVYDPRVGLYHRSTQSVDRYVEDASITVSNSIITTSAAHNLKTGDAVQFSNVTGLSGVDTSVVYYADVQSTTTLKLALSRKALEAGNTVTITGTVTSDKLLYVPNTDWAAGYDGFQGAIGLTTQEEAQLNMWESPIVWGARITDLAGNTVYALQGLTDSWNIGRVTTQKIYTKNLIETWKAVSGFISGVLNSNEKAILKYKKEDAGYPTSVLKGVWSTANTINSDTATYDEDEWDDIKVGDELTIVDGYGRGYTTHVTNISAGNTFVLTVDESIGTANGTVYFYADNFIKVNGIGPERQYKGLLQWAWSAVKSPWVQLKVELRGFQSELSAFDIKNGADK